MIENAGNYRFIFLLATAAICLPGVATGTEPKTRGTSQLLQAKDLERFVYFNSTEIWNSFANSWCNDKSRRTKISKVTFVGLPKDDYRVSKLTRDSINNLIQRNVGGSGRLAVPADYIGHIAKFMANDQDGGRKLDSHRKSLDELPFLVQASSLLRTPDTLHMQLSFADKREGCQNKKSFEFAIDLRKLKRSNATPHQQRDHFELDGFYRKGLEYFAPILEERKANIKYAIAQSRLRIGGDCLFLEDAESRFATHYVELQRELSKFINARQLPPLLDQKFSPEKLASDAEKVALLRQTFVYDKRSGRTLRATLELVIGGLLLQAYPQHIVLPKVELDGCKRASKTPRPEANQVKLDKKKKEIAASKESGSTASNTTSAKQKPYSVAAESKKQASKSQTQTSSQEKQQANNTAATTSKQTPKKPEATPSKQKPKVISCEQCPEMIRVRLTSSAPAKTQATRGVKSSGKPAAQTLFVSRGEVTVAQFKAFVDATGHTPTTLTGSPDSACRAPVAGSENQWAASRNISPWAPGFAQTDDHPVVCVSWHDAKAYVNWLAVTHGIKFRLLSETEHEFVSRAGTTTTYWWGDKVEQARANFEISNGQSSLGVRATVALGILPPNRWGFHHVTGNAAEWVEDCWVKQIAPSSKAGFKPRLDGDCTRRVIRGGGWTYRAKDITSTSRDNSASYMAYVDVGFRIAADE